MFYLRVFTCHALLVSTSFIFMMTLMMNSFDKYIYDIMIMYFLFASYLWNKLNMKLPRFLTVSPPSESNPYDGSDQLAVHLVLVTPQVLIICN